MTREEFEHTNFAPALDSDDIYRTIKAMGLTNLPVYVDILPDSNFAYGECFNNVLKYIEKYGGKLVCGWQFYELTYMIEAEFHGVWQNPEGILVDITPREYKVDKILFIQDKTLVFDGIRRDNFRYNKLNNPLVDDIIELEKRRFIIEDRAQNVNEKGEIHWNQMESAFYEGIAIASYEIEEMIRCEGDNNSYCACKSGLSYEQCHRKEVGFLLSAIDEYYQNK
jgi:hypothetical protein